MEAVCALDQATVILKCDVTGLFSRRTAVVRVACVLSNFPKESMSLGEISRISNDGGSWQGMR